MNLQSELSEMISISHRIDQNIDMVALHGRFTAVDAPMVSDELHRILEEGDKHLSIDMSELEFIDSSGLSIIVSTLKFARKGGGDLVLFNVNPRILALLKLTRLHEIIEIFHDEDSSVESFA